MNNQEKIMSYEDSKIFLKTIINRVRNELGINLFHPETATQCFEAIRSFSYIIYSTNIPSIVEQFPFKEIGLNNPIHQAGIVGIATNEGDKYFILDPTYIQFSMDKYTLNDNDTYIPPMHYLKTIEEINFGKELTTNGFIPLTKNNLKIYIGSFIKANNAKLPYIDENEALNKLIKQLGNKVESSNDEKNLFHSNR